MMIHSPYHKWQPLYVLIEATVVGLILGIAWQLAWRETESILVSYFGIFFLFQHFLGFLRQMKNWPEKYPIGEAYMFAVYFGTGLFPPLTLFFFFGLPMGIALLLTYFVTIRRIQRFSDDYDKSFPPAMICH